MKKYITLFIIAQLLDILTTIVAYYFMGFAELNPLVMSGRFSLFQLLIIKAIMILFVTMVLKRVPERRMYNILWIISGLPVIWNLLNIVVEVIYG